MSKTLKYIAGIIIILTCLTITKMNDIETIKGNDGQGLSESLESMSDRVSVAPNVPSPVTHPVSNPVHPIFKVEISN